MLRRTLTLLTAIVMVLAAAPLEGAFRASRHLDAVVQEAIERDEIPGAVLWVGHKGVVVHRKAYGFRALAPRRERMTLDTIFDAASLTKVVATTSAVMKLFEAGRLRLNDRVTRYLPEFQGGKSEITVRDLLTHFSGLRPDLDLEPAWSGYETGIQKALVDAPVAPPGTRFIYSDINFLLLGEIVRRLSGKPLDAYCGETVFRPLGMRETMFRPPERLRRRIAPTEILPGQRLPLRGVVHDPTARFMGGVAGHAGMFTTAADLARFAEMMLAGGRRGGVRIFSAATVEKFTTPQSPPHQPVLRGLGWDVDSPYSGNRGELFPLGSYGHTGFTGTSLWIDPATQTYVILLANSVHPKVRPAITSLRSRVATVVAAALDIRVPGVRLTGYNETLVGSGLRRVVARNAQVLTGLDVLVEEKFAPLRGRRVGLITNHTGLTRDGRRNVDVMLEAGVNVTALLSPEHGIGGTEERPDIPHSTDPATGIPIWSLYTAEGRRPTPEMLRDVDVLVFDIQDIGARFYTYVTTMAYAMEEAARHGLPFYVLDRPNPLTGVRVEGPLLDKELLSFVGYFPLPLVHGMTVGELARLFNGENRVGADLHVVTMRGWQRGDWFDSTGLVWVDPSPNMRSFNAALLYPGVAMLEASPNYSVGRGTDAPFEQVGADWIRGRELAAYLNARFLPGVRVYPTRFRPASSRFAGQWIEGVRFIVTDREAFSAARLGLELASALEKLFPGRLVLDANRSLIGNLAVLEALKAGEDPRRIEEESWAAVKEFLKLREKYLLYR
ncbi:MAG TPA: exo-beta-N-acetylmuramidase NamZ domain-containing protein [Bryobacteraceae bacterium]|nr:exo-beta-N-acetylmuramidase NamZ domain-containing protein [Bryobacteraceae bacterium]